MNELKEYGTLDKEEWTIYNYLKERSENGLWTSQNELVEYLLTKDIKMQKRALRKHIQRIRRCELIQKVILTSYTYGYKIMSEKEQVIILERRKNSILKSLKQYHRDMKRLSLDNQMKLTFSSKEREFIESLLRIDRKEEKENEI